MPIKRSKVKDLDFRTGDEHENWKQCYRCGRLVEIYNIKYETDKLRGFTEPSDDPFDFGKAQISGIKRDIRKPKEYEDIKDENLRNELRKGSILLEYSETEP